MHDEVPAQIDGSCLDTVRKISFETEELAAAHFAAVKDRLLNVNLWFEVCCKKHSHFYVCDTAGNCKNEPIAVGDYVRISVKGLDNASGDGDDWVMLEELIDEADRTSFTVRPCAAPINNSDEVAHFFDERSTNTFEVRRDGKEIIVEIHGRNEHINTETDSLLNAVRNTAMAVGGFLFGSKSQWEELAEGLIKL